MIKRLYLLWISRREMNHAQMYLLIFAVFGVNRPGKMDILDCKKSFQPFLLNSESPVPQCLKTCQKNVLDCLYLLMKRHLMILDKY